MLKTKHRQSLLIQLHVSFSWSLAPHSSLPSPCLLPQWLTLEDVPSGRLHMRLERLTPRPTAAELEEVRKDAGRRKGPRVGQRRLFCLLSRRVPALRSAAYPHPLVLPKVLQVNSLIQAQKSADLAAALLSVYLERAEGLPVRPAPHAPQLPGPPTPLRFGCFWGTCNSKLQIPLSQGGTGMGRIVCPRPGRCGLSSGNRDMGCWPWGRGSALTGAHLRPVFSF